MQIHAVMVVASLVTQEGHAILGSPVTGPHDIAATSRRRSSIDSRNGTRRILASSVRDIEADDRTASARGRPFDKQDLGYLPVLSKVFVRTKGWYQLCKGVSERV
jgi:hypothetical protein